MTDDLRSDLMELTDPRPVPADPAAHVRQRVVRVRRRRRGAVTVLAAAAVTGAAVAAGPVLGALRADRPAVGGSPGSTTGAPAAIGSPTPTPTRVPTPAATPTYNDPAKNAKLPAPWTDEQFTKFPERNLYAPRGTVLATGTTLGIRWSAISFSDNMLSEGCIAVEATANEFGLDACFDDWPAGRRADWEKQTAYGGKKPDLEALDATFVGGAVSATARSVVIRTADGKEYHADAIGTPTSDKLRFFFVVVPQKGARVTSVRPLDAAGKLAAPPVGLPRKGGKCYEGPREGHPNGLDVCMEATPMR